MTFEGWQSSPRAGATHDVASGPVAQRLTGTQTSHKDPSTKVACCVSGDTRPRTKRLGCCRWQWLDHRDASAVHTYLDGRSSRRGDGVCQVLPTQCNDLQWAQ